MSDQQVQNEAGKSSDTGHSGVVRESDWELAFKLRHPHSCDICPHPHDHKSEKCRKCVDAQPIADHLAPERKQAEALREAGERLAKTVVHLRNRLKYYAPEPTYKPVPCDVGRSMNRAKKALAAWQEVAK